jgi:hypothetical protein
MTAKVREIGPKLPGLSHVIWSGYGTNEAIWAESVLRLFTSDFRIGKTRAGCIIPDLRAHSDVVYLREHHFDIYFVLCTEGTRRERIRKLGEESVWSHSWDKDYRFEHNHVGVVEHLNTYISNYFLHPCSMESNTQSEKDFQGKIIWNDDVPAPVWTRDFTITMDDFLSRIRVSEGMQPEKRGGFVVEGTDRPLSGQGT